MASGMISNVKVSGVSCCLPDNLKVNINEYDKFGEELVNKFIDKTGVEQRYVTKNKQCASDLSYEAANNLLNELDWERSEVDGLIFITQSPDYRKPSTACILQDRLGLDTDIMAFDVNLGCSAFVYGMSFASFLAQNNNINKLLVLIGDTTSSFISPEDAVTLLHGDAGSAIALEKEQNNDTIKYNLNTDGSKFDKLYIPAGACRNMYDAKEERYENEDGVFRSDYDHFMDGLAIFQFTITQVPKDIKKFMDKNNLKADDFDYLLLHQANKGIINRISKKLGFTKEQTLINLDKFGNCSGSTIPLLIADKLKNKTKNKKTRILAAGFGIGLSWGVVDFNLEDVVIPDIEYTNNYFDPEKTEAK